MKEGHSLKREWWRRLSEEEKAKHARETREGMASMTDEEREAWRQSVSDGTNAALETETFRENMRKRNEKYQPKKKKKSDDAHEGGDLDVV